jgi:formate dehydrogenase subunit delta
MADTNQKLVRMAEQIAANCSYHGDQELVADKVADHLNRFWDPRMRTAITAMVAEADLEISDVLRLALSRIHTPGD